MNTEVRRALNLAARIVEEEALLFYEEAAEVIPNGIDETPENKEAWAHHDITKGRALSLRKLANAIRSLRP